VNDPTPAERFEALRTAEVSRLEAQNAGLVTANREMFALYAESMRELTQIHAEIADVSDTMDALSRRLCTTLRKLRRHAGVDAF
jgi:hypothetical protein